jgi:hypothetical protein
LIIKTFIDLSELPKHHKEAIASHYGCDWKIVNKHMFGYSLKWSDVIHVFMLAHAVKGKTLKGVIDELNDTYLHELIHNFGKVNFESTAEKLVRKLTEKKPRRKSR